MQLRTQILSISIAVFLITVTWRLIHRRRLREAHSLLYLLAGLVLLALSINRGALSAVARLFHIGYPPTLLLSTGVLFALVIQLSHSVSISSVTRQNRDLAQEVAMLRLLLEETQTENRIREVREGEWPDPAQVRAISVSHDLRQEWSRPQPESVAEEVEALV